MNALARFLAVTAAFGLLGPPIGLTVLLTGIAASQGFQFDPINWSDFGYSVFELGLPAAAAGAVFFGATYSSPRWFRPSHIRHRATLAAMAMLLVFGIPLAEKLLYGHFSATWASIALAACATGLIVGSLLPARLLVRSGAPEGSKRSP